MNRYAWWKYLIIAVALFIGLIYALMCTALAFTGRWLERRWPAIQG